MFIQFKFAIVTGGRVHYINDENEYLVNKEDFHIHAITGLLFENIVMIIN